MMKGVFFILLFLFLMAIAWVFIFLLTFDANKYKPFLTQKIEQAINKDARIGTISLNILPSVAFKLDGLTIKDLDRAWEDAFLRVGSVELSIKLMPLIKRQIQIEHLNIRGLNLNIKEGQMIALPRPATASEYRDVDAGLLTAGALKFLAKSITITNSNIYYSTSASGHPVNIKLDIIEALLKNVSMYGPVNISARVSFFGRGIENIKFNALLYPEFDTKKPFIEDLDLNMDLSNLDLNKVFSILGNTDVVKNGLVEEVKGKLAISAEKMLLDPDRIFDSNININLSDGALVIMPIRQNVRDVELRAEVNRENLKLEKLTGWIAGGNFLVTGTLKDMLVQQKLDLVAELHDLDIAVLQEDAKHRRPRFEGTLNMAMHSSASGISPEKILETLQLYGSISIERPILRNINVLTKALARLDMLPGLVDSLKRRLPEHYKELLKQDYTAFKPIEAKFSFKDKRLLFQETTVESDAFYLVANGYFGINKDVAVDSDLFIPHDLSYAFIDVVHEFKYLQNSQGMITMPVSIQGIFPDISVRPDLDYVIQRLVVSKGEELIENIFKRGMPDEQKEPEKEKDMPEGEGKQKPEEIEPGEAILRGIFDIITRPREK